MKIVKNRPTAPFLLAVPFLLLAVAASAIASDAPRVPRTTLAAAEKSLDNRFAGLWSDNPFIMLGPTRGVYLEGYGAVFTAEVNLRSARVMQRLGMTHDLEDDFDHPKLSAGHRLQRHVLYRIKNTPQTLARLKTELGSAKLSHAPGQWAG